MLSHLPWAKDCALLHFLYLPLFTFICECLWSSLKKRCCKPKGSISLQPELSLCNHLHSIIITSPYFTTSPFLLGPHLSGRAELGGTVPAPPAAGSGGCGRVQPALPLLTSVSPWPMRLAALWNNPPWQMRPRSPAGAVCSAEGSGARL